MTARVSFTDRIRKIREILAENLKKNRRLRGWTQELLAEKADVSSHYVAMVETCKTFPTPEMLERLAEALEIETYQLFDVSATPEAALLHLEQTIVANIEKLVTTSVKQAVALEFENYEKKAEAKQNPTPDSGYPYAEEKKG